MSNVFLVSAMKLTISLGQMDVQVGRPNENVAKVRELTAAAARRGSQLVAFPELWSTGYDLSRSAELAVAPDQGPYAEMAALARTHGIHIVGSCLAQIGKGRFGNT